MDFRRSQRSIVISGSLTAPKPKISFFIEPRRQGLRWCSVEQFYARGDILRVPLSLGGKGLSYPVNIPAPDGVQNTRRRFLSAYFWPLEMIENGMRMVAGWIMSAHKFRNRFVHVTWAVIEKTRQ
jgi:hypothetical protein